MNKHGMLPDTKCCVADGVSTQAAILVYRRVYLCASHRRLWDAANRLDSHKKPTGTKKRGGKK